MTQIQEVPFGIDIRPRIIELKFDDPIVKEALFRIIGEYKGTVIASNIKRLNRIYEGSIKGSDPYTDSALILKYRELSGRNILPINPEQSEQALAEGVLNDPVLTNPEEMYLDIGLFSVFPEKGVNTVTWENIREQAKEYFRDSVNLELPFIVTGLMKPVKDGKFEKGIRPDYIEGLTRMYNVPILAQGNGYFDADDSQLQINGFPGKLFPTRQKETDRYLATSSNGVLRLYRDTNQYLDAEVGNLVGSIDTGRVQVVENFPRRNLDEIVR